MKKLLLILLCLPMIGFGQIDTIDCKKFKTDTTERENKLVSKWENDFSISQEIYFIKDGITFCNTKEYFIIK